MIVVLTKGILKAAKRYPMMYVQGNIITTTKDASVAVPLAGFIALLNPVWAIVTNGTTLPMGAILTAKMARKMGTSAPLVAEPPAFIRVLELFVAILTRKDVDGFPGFPGQGTTLHAAILAIQPVALEFLTAVLARIVIIGTWSHSCLGRAAAATIYLFFPIGLEFCVALWACTGKVREMLFRFRLGLVPSRAVRAGAATILCLSALKCLKLKAALWARNSNSGWHGMTPSLMGRLDYKYTMP